MSERYALLLAGVGSISCVCWLVLAMCGNMPAAKKVDRVGDWLVSFGVLVWFTMWCFGAHL